MPCPTYETTGGAVTGQWWWLGLAKAEGSRWEPGCTQQALTHRDNPAACTSQQETVYLKLVYVISSSKSGETYRTEWVRCGPALDVGRLLQPRRLVGFQHGGSGPTGMQTAPSATLSGRLFANCALHKHKTKPPVSRKGENQDWGMRSSLTKKQTKAPQISKTGLSIWLKWWRDSISLGRRSWYAQRAGTRLPGMVQFTAESTADISWAPPQPILTQGQTSPGYRFALHAAPYIGALLLCFL